MPWRPFLAYNAAGGIVWATLIGLGGYVLGDNVHRVVGPLGIGLATLAALLIGAGVLYLRRHEESLADQAERAMHGRLSVSAGSEPAQW